MKATTKSGRSAEVALLALCLCLAAGVKLAFHACGQGDGGAWMHCHKAENAAFALGIILTALSLLHFPAKDRAKLALDGAIALLAIGVLAFPGARMPLCAMEGMRCRAVMRPGVQVTSSLILAAAAADALVRLPRKGRRA